MTDMKEAHEIIDSMNKSKDSDLPWLAIPFIWIGSLLGAYAIIGVFRVMIAWFLAAFFRNEYQDYTIWNSKVADRFIDATSQMHDQSAHIISLAILAFMIFMKLTIKNEEMVK